MQQIKVCANMRKTFQRLRAMVAAEDLKRCRELYATASQFCSKLDKIVYPLLSNDEVVRWMHFDPFEGSQRVKKISEDAWGKSTVSSLLGKKAHSQWSAILGEAIARELYLLNSHQQTTLIPQPEVAVPAESSVHTLDWAVVVNGGLDRLVEVKCGSYNTRGTAWQKIYGVPILYKSVPAVVKCPIDICIIAGQERIIRLESGMGRKHADFNFIGATEILRAIVTQQQPQTMQKLKHRYNTRLSAKLYGNI